MHSQHLWSCMIRNNQWRGGLRPGLWTQPEALPEIPPSDRIPQPVQPPAKDTDQTRGTAWQRGQRSHEPCGGDPLLLRVFGPGAIRHAPEHRDRQHQPMAGDARRGRPAGVGPLPADPFERPAAQLDPHPQPIPAHPNLLGGHIGEEDPRRRR